MTVGTVLGGLVGLLLVAAPAQAATTTFTGSVDQDWNTAGNWSAGVPTAADDAVIPNGKAAVLSGGASAAARKLLVEAGSTLHIAGDIDLAGGASLIEGMLHVTGDSPTVSTSGGDVEVRNTGTIVRDGPGTWTVMAPLRSSGTLELRGGTLAAPEGVVVESGTFKAIGTVTGDLTNAAGILALGASPGRLTVTGDYTQGEAAKLRFGAYPGAFPLEDRLVVGGTAALDGEVWIWGEANLDLGTTIDVVTADAVSGAFDMVGGDVGADRHLQASYPAGAARLTVVQSPPIPQNMKKPSLPAGARRGETVTCDPGTWSPAPHGYHFNWYFEIDGLLVIVPHEASTITIPADDRVTKVACAVLALDGVTEIYVFGEWSNFLLVAGPAPVNQVAPTVTADGGTLTCDPGRWTGQGAITYGWLRDGTPIEGQTALTYAITDADAGHGISCRSTSTDPAGGVSADSNVVAIPARPAPQAPATPETPGPATPRSPVTVPIARLATLPAARRCAGPRSLRLRLRDAGARAEIFVDGRRVKVAGGKARVTLRRLPKGRWTLKIVSTAANGELRQATRRYSTCAPKKRR